LVRNKLERSGRGARIQRVTGCRCAKTRQRKKARPEMEVHLYEGNENWGSGGKDNYYLRVTTEEKRVKCT